MKKSMSIILVLVLMLVTSCSSERGYTTSYKKKKGFSREQKYVARHRNLGGYKCGMAGGVNRPVQ